MKTEAAPAPRPARGGLGCFGKACGTLAGLLIFLVLALMAGAYFGLHYLRGFSAEKPVLLPVVEKAEVRPRELREGLAGEQGVPTVADWEEFQEAAERGEAVRLELTADKINQLIAEEHEARGKVYVTIDGNVGRVRISLPLQRVPMMEGRYLNGELRVESSPDGDPAKVQVTEAILNGRPVPEAFLDRSLFGYPSLRSVVTQWIADQHIASFRIENGRVIGESKARP